MGIREAVNGRPGITAAVVVAVIAVALGFALKHLLAGQERVQTLQAPKAWYTVDDGRSWFAGPGNKVCPFDHEGKTAYRCYVWSCDGGKTKFVSHLERLEPSMRHKYGPQAEVEPWKMPPGGEQVKLPGTGDSGWVGEESPQAAQIIVPRCPDGKGTLEAVLAQ
jgi:hypothetical protein